MIIKNFELEKLKSKKVKKILFYGENEGYKNQIINNFFIKKFSDNFEKYEENQISYDYLRRKISHESRPFLLLFGTSWGLSERVVQDSLLHHTPPPICITLP